MLALVHMSEFAERKPRQLSGGQQQRIALARCLAIDPAVLLLDEPFGALDKNLRLDMQIEVKRLQRQYGITTILVTHDQEEALSMADRIACRAAIRAPRAVVAWGDRHDELDARQLCHFLHRPVQLFDPNRYAAARREGDAGLLCLRLSGRMAQRARQCALAERPALPSDPADPDECRGPYFCMDRDPWSAGRT